MPRSLRSFLRTAALPVRRLAEIFARTERSIRNYITATTPRRRASRLLGLLLFGSMTVTLMGTDECASCRPVLSIFMPSFIANILIDEIEDSFFGNLRGLAHPQFKGTDGSQTGVASFLGNFTSVTQPAGSYFFLARNPDCTLTMITGTSPLDGTASANAATAHYELTLHQLASLKTTPGLYPRGCAGSYAGISSRIGVLAGRTTQGVTVLAMISSASTNSVYVLTANSALTSFNFNAISALTNASALNTGDLNGDGNGDLVVVNGAGTATTPNISVLIGKPDGTFQNPVTYAVAGTQYAVSAVVDDVNGDGKADIVTVSDDQHISVLLGNGDGTFQSATTFAVPALPGYASSASTPILGLITADVNGDGKKDLICSNGLVLLGNGAGSFNAVSTPAFPYSSSNPGGFGPGLAWGDLNNDGKADLVLDTGTTISTWIGRGDGTFTAGASYASMNNSGYVTVTDLDGDGNLDIYSGLANGGLLSGDDSLPAGAYALMGNGDGTFVGASKATGAYNGTNLGDVNGDGVPDLVTQNANGSFSVQLGNGKGAFTTASTFSAPASFVLDAGNTLTSTNTTLATTYGVADINGDGKADLVLIESNLPDTYTSGTGFFRYNGGPVVFTAISNGDGTFQTPVGHAFPQIAPASGFDNTLAVSGMQIADINKDGKNDLIFTYNETAGGPGTLPYNQGLVVLAGLGNGTFSTTPVLTSTYSSNTAPTTASVPRVVSTADLNGDGKPDLIVNVPGTTIVNFQLQTTLVTYVGNGDGTFKTPTTIPVGANAYGLPALADFNKDGKVDLAVLAETSASQAELVVALGNGDGTFAAPTVSNLTGGDSIRSASLVAADFDSDTKADLALLDSADFSGVFYGKGDGTFTSVPGSGYIVPKDLLNVAAGGTAVAVDLNKDAKPDVVAGSTVLLSLYGNAPVTTAPSTAAVTASASSVAPGTSVTFTATVAPASGTGTPTGTVTFLDGSTTLGTGTLNASGVATYTTSSLSAGTHAVTVSYAGDSSFSPSASPAVSVTVTAPIGTTTALAASATNAVSGTSITFTATVSQASGSATPAGTVTFKDGTTTLGTGTLNGSGVATYATAALGVGSHSITASYGGAAGFSASASTALGVTITAAPPPPDFTVALSAASVTVQVPNTVFTTLTLTPAGGYTASTAITCTGAPANSLCNVIPTSITSSGGTFQPATISLATRVSTASLVVPRSGISFAALPACFLAAFVLFARRRGSLPQLTRTLALALAATACLMAVTACGGKGSAATSATTAPGTYTLTIAATSGSTVHSTPWTVTVQ